MFGLVDPELKVVEMLKDMKGDYVFETSSGNKSEYLRRSEVMKLNILALLRFYESNINFKDDMKS